MILQKFAEKQKKERKALNQEHFWIYKKTFLALKSAIMI